MPSRSLLRRTSRADDAFQRVAGAPLIGGNCVRVLRDGRENYPAWLEAIERATRTIHLEMYILRHDTIGRRFLDLLAARAHAGIAVRILYDWFGSLRPLDFGMWRKVRAAGAEVRAVNPPRLDSIVGWASRDHRKLLTVDGADAFVSGLCIGDDWIGRPERGQQPWRDTGVQITGPAAAETDTAFAQAWDMAGDPLPDAALARREWDPPAGDVAVRVIPTAPETTGLYRLDLLVASAARDRLWLTDAYFMATSPYRHALGAAARDGVDVRLLLPHGSDIEWVGNISRTFYRSLIEAGVRIFEWNGSMVHAKTAVADGRWARVGSTNLNLASWIGNWELDVAIEDAGVASVMEDHYLEDLENATEIVLTPRNKVRLERPLPRTARRGRLRGRGSRGRVLGNAAGLGSMVTAAVSGHRTLGPAESSALLSVSLVLLGFAALAIFFPSAVSYVFAGLLAAVAAPMLVRAIRLRFSREGPDDS